METHRRLSSQVAAEAEVAADVATLAVYLLDLSRAGKTLDQAAALTRRERWQVRDIARDWGIAFPDYEARAPRVMTWARERPGRWTLKLDGLDVAEATSEELSPGRRGYRARSLMDAAPEDSEGSSAEVAIRRLSIRLDQQARRLFDADDVAIWMQFPDGCRDQMAPKVAEQPERLRRALAA